MEGNKRSARKRTIGLLTFDFFPIYGGQGRYLYELVLRAHQEGETWEIIAPGRNTLPRHHSVFPFLQGVPHAQIVFSLLISPLVRFLVRKWNVQLLVVSGGPGGVLLLQRQVVPLFVIAHHTYSQQSRLLSKQRWKRIFIHIEKLNYQRACCIIADSFTTRSELIDHYKIPEEKVVVIHPAIDIERFSPTSEEKIPHSLLFVGRLEERKGALFFLEILGELKRRKCTFVAYIGGRGSLESKMREYVQRYNLDDLVTFLGYVPEKDLPSWYSKCEVFVVPSVLEGFGLSAAEAMACETAVVASEVPGLTDIITHGQDGFLARSGDAEAFAHYIDICLTDSKVRTHLAKQGRESVVRRFSWDTTIQKFQEVLHQYRSNESVE